LEGLPLKVLLCTLCLDIRALDPEGAWTCCRCGNSEARWLDAEKGSVRCRAKDRSKLRVIGMNNKYLVVGVRGPSYADLKLTDRWAWWRKLHEASTLVEGLIFDKDKRACWATILKVGDTNDISWEPDSQIPSS
jgi:hypothetical protein